LRKGKEYVGLTEILKRNNISFRWEKLEGVRFTFQERRYKLNSIQKAKDFLERHKKELEHNKTKIKETNS